MTSELTNSQASEEERIALAKFALVWNQIIRKLRLEDLISNRFEFLCC